MPEQPCAFHPDRTTAVSCSRCDRPICPDDHYPAPVGIHCPVCAGKMREGPLGGTAYRARVRVERVPALRRLGGLSVTKLLLIANVTVAGLMLLTGSPTSHQTLVRFGALITPLPRDEWWRMLTAMFVHIGFVHLLFNMYGLWLFGHAIEQRFGTLRFLGLYLGAGLVGSAASLAFTEPGVGAGASGGLFGILGAWIAISLQQRSNPAARGQLTSLFVLVGINLFWGFSVAGIDNAAHLGGLAAGLVVGTGAELATRRREPVWQVAGVAGYAVAIVTALVLALPKTV